MPREVVLRAADRRRRDAAAVVRRRPDREAAPARPDLENVVRRVQPQLARDPLELRLLCVLERRVRGLEEGAGVRHVAPVEEERIEIVPEVVVRRDVAPAARQRVGPPAMLPAQSGARDGRRDREGRTARLEGLRSSALRRARRRRDRGSSRGRPCIPPRAPPRRAAGFGRRAAGRGFPPTPATRRCRRRRRRRRRGRAPRSARPGFA